MINHDTPEGPGQEQLKKILSLLLPIDMVTGPWVAGGAARRLLQGLPLDDGDIDLFFHSFKSWSDFEQDLIKKGYEKTFRSANATTFVVEGFKVQIIRRRYYSNLKEVLTDFDMSACQVAVNGDKIVSLLTAGDDIKDNVLRYGTEHKITMKAAVPRGLKYINYGFKPVPGFFKEMVKKGMSCTSSYQIFDGDSSAHSSSFYDTDEVEAADVIANREEDENKSKSAVMDILEKLRTKND